LPSSLSFRPCFTSASASLDDAAACACAACPRHVPIRTTAANRQVSTGRWNFMGAIIPPKEGCRRPEQVEKRGEKMLIAPAKMPERDRTISFHHVGAGVLTCPIELSANRSGADAVSGVEPPRRGRLGLRETCRPPLRRPIARPSKLGPGNKCSVERETRAFPESMIPVNCY
jgi:hypothetical protein